MSNVVKKMIYGMPAEKPKGPKPPVDHIPKECTEILDKRVKYLDR